MQIDPHPRHAVLAALVAGTFALAACGSSGGSGGSGGASAGAGGGAAASTAAGGAATTVAVRSTGKGMVLTNASGRTLYVSDQENGKVLCSSSACTAIWIPLTVGSGVTPKAPSGVSGTLSTIKRPDGKMQVTLDGRPLYTFSFDHSAGDTSGDGQRDSFGGTNFSWHVATTTGAIGSAPSSAPSSSNPYGY